MYYLEVPGGLDRGCKASGIRIRDIVSWQL